MLRGPCASVRLDCRSFVFMMCLCVSGCNSFDTRLCLCGALHQQLPTICVTFARIFLSLSNTFSLSGASGDACRNMVILRNRQVCLQVDVGLRTSAAHVSMSSEVLSGGFGLCDRVLQKSDRLQVSYQNSWCALCLNVCNAATCYLQLR